MRALFAFVAGPGRDAFEQLKQDNAAEFPEYVEELRGMAEGAAVELDQVWAATMLSELEALMPRELREKYAFGHCSDIYAPEVLAHNEDWPGAIKQFWYFVAYHGNGSIPELRCAGMVYPGTILGWAGTWSDSLFMTQNSLFAKQGRSRGLVAAFVQRRAVCGSKTLDEAAAKLVSRQ